MLRSIEQYLRSTVLPESVMDNVERIANRIVVSVLKNGPIPHHMAFIMDGNRRYAKKGAMAKIEGHALGFNTLKKTLDWCFDLGIRCVTVYAFSIENFNRPQEEVDDLMDLAKRKFLELADNESTLHKNKMSIRILGDLSLLRPDVLEVLMRVVEDTKMNTDYILNVCFPYTSQEEMATAARRIAGEVEAGDISIRSIDEQCFADHLYTAGCGEVDVLVRTSGEIRLSDFLLWQSSFSLLSYREVLWPDFSVYEFISVILDYQQSQAALMSIKDNYEVARARGKAQLDAEYTRLQARKSFSTNFVPDDTMLVERCR